MLSVKKVRLDLQKVLIILQPFCTQAQLPGPGHPKQVPMVMYRSSVSKGWNFSSTTYWTSTLVRGHQIKTPVLEPTSKRFAENKEAFAPNEAMKSPGMFCIVKYQWSNISTIRLDRENFKIQCNGSLRPRSWKIKIWFQYCNHCLRSVHMLGMMFYQIVFWICTQQPNFRLFLYSLRGGKGTGEICQTFQTPPAWTRAVEPLVGWCLPMTHCLCIICQS